MEHPTSVAPVGKEYAQNVATKLASLVRLVNDGERVYRVAANDVTLPHYRERFLALATERASFVIELERFRNDAAADQPVPRSARAELREGWMDVKAALTGDDELAAVASCLRSEGETIKGYEDALSDRLLPELEATLRQQYALIKEAYDLLARLRGA